MYRFVKLPILGSSKGKPGPKPKPSSHPLGRLIRRRREALGWSTKRLAEEVGIGPNSVALVTLMEFGKRPPRVDVARRLARVLELDEGALVQWAQTRHRPLSAEEVTAARQDLEAKLIAEPISVEYGPRPLGSPLQDGPVQPDDIPVYVAGVDPDNEAASTVAYLRRGVIPPHVPLVRPIAYRITEADVLRLEKVQFPPGYAIVSRAPSADLHRNEPYAVRLAGRVVLAYVWWDGRELVLYPEVGRSGFERVSALGAKGLQKAVVGQIVVGIEDHARW